MVTLSTYQNYLLMVSQGNPIKLAILLNNDLHNKKQEAFDLMNLGGYVDHNINDVINIAEYLVKTKTV